MDDFTAAQGEARAHKDTASHLSRRDRASLNVDPVEARAGGFDSVSSVRSGASVSGTLDSRRQRSVLLCVLGEPWLSDGCVPTVSVFTC